MVIREHEEPNSDVEDEPLALQSLQNANLQRDSLQAVEEAATSTVTNTNQNLRYICHLII